MDVILLERVEKLGRIGDVVSVKPGFARNFLLPRGKALRATDRNKAKFEAERAEIEAESERRREAATASAATMTDVTVILIRQASSAGSLYGSVSARDIAEVLAAAGHKVARTAVVLDRPIKLLGLHDVKLVLHPEVSVSVRVNVARSPEEAELQAKGIDVTAAHDEIHDVVEEAETAAETEVESGAESGEAVEDQAADETEA